MNHESGEKVEGEGKADKPCERCRKASTELDRQVRRARAFDNGGWPKEIERALTEQQPTEREAEAEEAA